jgi:uncharacterized protein (DUF4415 family)
MKKSFEPGRGYTEEDWVAVDSPQLTDEQLAGAKPFGEALPDASAAIRRRGPIRTKEAVSIRLDIDVVQKLRASGPGWQSRVNDALRDYVNKSTT